MCPWDPRGLQSGNMYCRILPFEPTSRACWKKDWRVVPLAQDNVHSGFAGNVIYSSFAQIPDGDKASEAYRFERTSSKGVRVLHLEARHYAFGSFQNRISPFPK